MRREHCGNCRNRHLNQFLDLGETPLADAFPASPDEIETWYPLGLCICERCHLVQLNYLVSDAELYQGDYGFYMGASTSQQGYWNAYVRQMAARFEGQCKQLVVEIASNDGTLLKKFQEHHYPTVGVDPAVGPSKVATDKGLTIRNESFTHAAAINLVNDHGHAGLIVANNVMAHVADLEDFVRGLHYLLDRKGVAVVEVQYLPDLLTGNMFDHVYHEHRYFFSLSSLEKCVAGLGLCVFDAELTEPQGGSLRVYLDKGSHSPTEQMQWLRKSEMWLSDWGVYDGFQGRVDHIKARLLRMLRQIKEDGLVIDGYAASAKSCTLLNYCGIGTRYIDQVVDTTPQKIGRFTPGTNIPIVEKPGEEPDAYLLLAHNYASSLVRKYPNVKWLVPIPLPVIL